MKFSSSMEMQFIIVTFYSTIIYRCAEQIGIALQTSRRIWYVLGSNLARGTYSEVFLKSLFRVNSGQQSFPSKSFTIHHSPRFVHVGAVLSRHWQSQKRQHERSERIFWFQRVHPFLSPPKLTVQFFWSDLTSDAWSTFGCQPSLWSIHALRALHETKQFSFFSASVSR